MKFINWAMLVAMLLQVVACSRGSDEEQIRSAIDALERAAEARDTSDVMDWVAEDYRDNQGFDKAQLQQFVRGYFVTHPKIELLVRVAEVNVETANSARVRVEFALVGTQLSGQSGSALAGESESLQVDFKRIDSNWLVARVARLGR